jgi:serine protein kinase
MLAAVLRRRDPLFSLFRRRSPMTPSESLPTGSAGDVPPLISKIAGLQNLKEYAELHWSGSFEDYLTLIRKNPAVTRTAFQRVYDMILSYGQEEYIDNKKRLIRYNFFKDDQHGGRDAIYGLDIPLMRLVSVLQSAAQRYGTERRVILLHGPVGSSKSTIARLVKRGIEEYSRTPEGAMYTYDWMLPESLAQIAASSSARCTRSRCA